MNFDSLKLPRPAHQRAAARVAPEPAEGVHAVRDLNQGYIDAARTSDAAWFDQHMAEDVLVILGSGRRLRKAEFVELVRKEPKDFRSLTVHSVELRTFGNIVQVDADAPYELGDGTRGVSRYIDTWAWIGGRWQVVSAQITAMADAGVVGG
ncbi:MAG TPA: nuclear transport factor 2 family protein [Gemmatimonadales bacterium]|nr:nuclear transport factor 2 family protein [Gemmatimonadales bacterium]